MLEFFRAVFASPRDLILLVAAGWAGLWLAEERAKRTPVGEKNLDALIGAMVLAFLLGGRIFYAAEHLPAFASSPASLISLNVSLFDIWGAAAAAAVVAGILIQRKRLPPWQMLDLLAPFLAALSIGLALSHLATGAAFGQETSLPWAINLWGAERHPTQVYELLAGIAVLVFVWIYGRRAALPGRTFLLWVAFTAGCRLVIEGFRGDSTLVFGGIRLAQIVAWVVLAAALLALEVLRERERERQLTFTDDEPVSEEPGITPSNNAKRRTAPRGDSAP